MLGVFTSAMGGVGVLFGTLALFLSPGGFAGFGSGRFLSRPVTISFSSHVEHMLGCLEARHEVDDVFGLLGRYVEALDKHLFFPAVWS